MEFLRQEDQIQTKQDYYLCQIAYQIFIANTSKKDRAGVKFSDFFLKYEKTFAEMTPEERIQQSKSIWMGVANAQKKNSEKVRLKNRTKKKIVKKLP